MKKALILFGGMSTEHEISCLSAASVLRKIDSEKYEVSAVGITKNGDWWPFDSQNDIEIIEKCLWQEKVPADCGLAPALPSIYAADVVFPVMHGIMAEDGTIQGLLTLLKKPFVGPGVLSSALCMDKAMAKIILDAAGIPQVKSITLSRDNIFQDLENAVKTAEETIGYPVFVKPSNSGSSVGAFKVRDRVELENALKEAAKYDTKVLCEEFINCKEVECAVLGNTEPIASTPGEIVSTSEFYDYDDKYKNGTSRTQIPALIDAETLAKIKEYAVIAYKALDCRGLSRVDFFVDKNSGKIYLNEINTIPGFTSISMYGKMMEYDGISYKELISRLLDLAERNFNENKRALL